MTALFDGWRVYIVVWPEECIVKVGCTGRRRWRTFANRGGQIYALYKFRNGENAYRYEHQLHRYLGLNAELATTDKTTAERYLGRGGGMLELHRMPDLAMLQALPEPPSGQCFMGPHRPFLSPNWLMPEAIHVRNVRTDLRTGAHSEMDLATNASRAIRSNPS